MQPQQRIVQDVSQSSAAKPLLVHHSTLQRPTQVSKMTGWDTSSPTGEACASKQACSSDASSKATIDTGLAAVQPSQPSYQIVSGTSGRAARRTVAQACLASRSAIDDRGSAPVG